MHRKSGKVRLGDQVFDHVEEPKCMKYFHRSLSGVVVHVNLLDLEDGINSRGAGAPALVTVGPVVPDPGSGNRGNILSALPLLDTVNVPLNLASVPVETVLVLGGGGVGRGGNGVVGLAAISIGVLVGEPEPASSSIGLRVGIGKPLNVGLLGVRFVEEHAWLVLVGCYEIENMDSYRCRHRRAQSRWQWFAHWRT